MHMSLKTMENFEYVLVFFLFSFINSLYYVLFVNSKAQGIVKNTLEYIFSGNTRSHQAYIIFWRLPKIWVRSV